MKPGGHSVGLRQQAGAQDGGGGGGTQKRRGKAGSSECLRGFGALRLEQ